MTRRDLLTAVELTLTASALSAATYGLVRAAYDPYAAVQWVPVAIVGLGVTLSLVGLAAALFVGRTALLLAGDAADAVQAGRWRRAAPTSGRPTPTADAIAEQRARAAAEEQQHAEAMAAVAAEPMQPQTIGYTAVLPTVTSGVTFGFGPRGVVEPQQQPWTPPASVNVRHAGMPAELQEFDWEPSGGGR